MPDGWIQRICVVPEASEDDRTAAADRLLQALEQRGFRSWLPVPLLRRKADLLRLPQVTATLLREEGRWRVVRLEPGDTSMRCFAAAVDLGSTTVGMRLLDVSSGSILAEGTARNGQRAYGDDILSCIFYTKDAPERRRELQAVTAATINSLLEELCAEAGIPQADCCAMAVAGK